METILDVREKMEFDNEYIEGSINLPLSRINQNGKSILSEIAPGKITIMCRSGMRAKMALETIQSMDLAQHKFSVYNGGIINWKSQGKATIKKAFNEKFNVTRQVHLVALVVLLTGLVGQQQFESLKYLPYLVCFGLALDAFTGFCPMRFFLNLAPWNKQ